MNEQLRREIEGTQYYIERSPKTGDYTLILSNEESRQYVLSKYDPRKSALNLLGEDLGNKSTIWIIFGFNYGYIIEKLKEVVGKNVNILIVEPNSDLLEKEKALINSNKYEKNINYFSGDDFFALRQLLNEMFGKYEFNNFRIVTNDKYLYFYNSYYKYILSIIDEASDERIMNYNTIIDNNTTFIINTVKNRYGIMNTCDMSKLAYQFKNIPAVIVSAGPSLEKNINELKGFNGLIFVMGRTLSPVLNLGVKPDFVVSVDSSDKIYESFGSCKEYTVPLITLGQGNSKVADGCKTHKYFLNNTNEVGGLLGARVNPVLDLSGSVATLCLSSAVYLGCSPIIFIGQDLAYEGDKVYADGSNSMNQKKAVPESWLKTIKSFYGGEVVSDVCMISFLRWFEEFIRNHPESNYINCTEGGAYIDGAEHMSFSEAIEKYNPEEKIEIKHEKLSDNDGIDVDKNLAAAMQTLEKIGGLLKEATEHYRNISEMFNSEKMQVSEITRRMKRIQKIDKKIENMPKSNILMDMLFERVRYTIATNNDNKEPINETEEQLKKRKLRLNYETYSSLQKECESILNLLKDIIQGGVQ